MGRSLKINHLDQNLRRLDRVLAYFMSKPALLAHSGCPSVCFKVAKKI